MSGALRGLFLRSRAHGIHAALRDGESPESIARSYSMDPGQVRLIGATRLEDILVPVSELAELNPPEKLDEARNAALEAAARIVYRGPPGEIPGVYDTLAARIRALKTSAGA